MESRGHRGGSRKEEGWWRKEECEIKTQDDRHTTNQGCN